MLLPRKLLHEVVCLGALISADATEHEVILSSKRRCSRR